MSLTFKDTFIFFIFEGFGKCFKVMKHIFDFRDPAVQALQFLECINSKDTNQKAQFFRNSLPEVFPIIPKVGECILGLCRITMECLMKPSF